MGAPNQSLLAEDLRAVMGRFATGVTIVTTDGPGEQPLGSTANAVASVSLNPPLVLVCLREESETLAALRGSGGFAINVLAEDQRHLADRFATAACDGQWEGVAYETAATGHPLLTGTLAALECAHARRGRRRRPPDRHRPRAVGPPRRRAAVRRCCSRSPRTT